MDKFTCPNSILSLQFVHKHGLFHRVFMLLKADSKYQQAVTAYYVSISQTYSGHFHAYTIPIAFPETFQNYLKRDH